MVETTPSSRKWSRRSAASSWSSLRSGASRWSQSRENFVIPHHSSSPESVKPSPSPVTIVRINCIIGFRVSLRLARALIYILVWSVAWCRISPSCSATVVVCRSYSGDHFVVALLPIDSSCHSGLITPVCASWGGLNHRLRRSPALSRSQSTFWPIHANVALPGPTTPPVCLCG
jgi:hypothetical protein